MKLVIHTPGRLNVPGTSEGVNEYIRRISDWTLRHERGLPGQQSEGEAWVGLDAGGKMTTTEGVHKWLNHQANQGVDRIGFLIGGKDGLTGERKKSCDWSWSLGPLVLNQSIAALVVAEQCYRCYCLRTGHPYHDE